MTLRWTATDAAPGRTLPPTRTRSLSPSPSRSTLIGASPPTRTPLVSRKNGTGRSTLTAAGESRRGPAARLDRERARKLRSAPPPARETRAPTAEPRTPDSSARCRSTCRRAGALRGRTRRRAAALRRSAARRHTAPRRVTPGRRRRARRACADGALGVERPIGGHRRGELVRRPERRERRRGGEHLHVRGRRERRVGVAREQVGAGRGVDDEGADARAAAAGFRQHRGGEPVGEGGVGAGVRGRQQNDDGERRGAQPGHPSSM